jgi:hypothetical protein
LRIWLAANIVGVVGNAVASELIEFTCCFVMHSKMMKQFLKAASHITVAVICTLLQLSLPTLQEQLSQL